MPALDSDLDTARALFEANFFAVVAMTKAFAPFLVAAKGLVVNIGSCAGVCIILFIRLHILDH